jgi:hypothetical protein
MASSNDLSASLSVLGSSDSAKTTLFYRTHNMKLQVLIALLCTTIDEMLPDEKELDWSQDIKTTVNGFTIYERRTRSRNRGRRD